jgi:hypothetical protein
MWGIPSITNTLVIIAPHTTFMACIWIQRGTYTPFSIAAYKQYVCTHFQVGRGIIFNPTWMQACIADFLKQYSLHGVYIAFMPDRTSVTHGFMEIDQLTPTTLPVECATTRHTESGSDYIYTNEQHKHVHYWYHLPRTLLMQYQCIATANNLNCIRITPRFCALLHAYQAVQGVAFRRTQLSIDLMKVNNRIAYYFSPNITRRLVQVANPHVYSDMRTMIDIIAACGIAYLHREHV